LINEYYQQWFNKWRETLIKFVMNFLKQSLLYVRTDWTKVAPLSRVLPEKLTGPQIVKKFPVFYGTRRFITGFTRASHLSLSWARSIQSMHPVQILEDPF
jgi:hypothetical protein